MITEDRVRQALVDHAQDLVAVPDVHALVARGTQARRRRLTIIASIVATVVIAVVAAAPMVRSTTESPPVGNTPSPEWPTASVGPSPGVGFFEGSANVPVAFTVPASWTVVKNNIVSKDGGADSALGVTLVDVASLYADGCRRLVLKPAVGPSVDDLVAAYRKIPALRATAARPVTVDGFRGQRLRYTIPAHRPEACQESMFDVFQVDNAGSNTVEDFAFNLYAQTPNQQNEALILDVDGTRLVILIFHPPGISTQDRADLDAIVGSVKIG